MFYCTEIDKILGAFALAIKICRFHPDLLLRLDTFMNVHKITYSASIFLLLSFCAFISSCDKKVKIDSSDYEKLCNIYQEVVPQTISLTEKETKIADQVMVELPEFYQLNFIYIQQADPDKRYQFFKRLAENATKKSWTCETMKNFYAKEFH